MPAVKIITGPTEEPVTLAQAKDQCSIDGNEFDALLTGVIIPTARQAAEHETGRALCTQTREVVVDKFEYEIILRGSPIQSLTSVKYLDVAGAEQAMNLADVIIDKDGEPGSVVPAYGKEWPDTYPVPNAVRIRYICGYGDAAAVPAGIKSWMLLAIGTMFANRETITDSRAEGLPDRFWHRLLDPYRMYEAI